MKHDVAPPETTLVAAQWFARARYTWPMQRLAVAIIESAMRDCRRKKYRDGAMEWIVSDSDGPFSLRWVCDALELEFAYVQARLLLGL